MDALTKTDDYLAEPRKMVIRKIETARDGEIAAGFIPDVDDLPEDPQNTYQWELATSADVDTAVRDIQAQADSWRTIEQNAKDHRMYQEGRLTRVLDKYGHLIACEVPVELGKSRRFWTGPISGGKYCHTPDRLPAIKVVDKDKAMMAGMMRVRTVVDPDTDAIRAQPELAVKHGIELIPQPTVSYTPPKGGK